MSLQKEKNSSTNKKTPDNDDILVYEPFRRNCFTEQNESISKEKLTRKFTGLYNRGNTCYLNSLIQTLFMTPDFRSHILTWKFQENLHGKREDSIPFQIQKLFARLQLKFFENETTEPLTKSFQWNSQQLLEQHDIQELCRVLFEAIENSFLDVEENFINNLYSGDTVSIVRCLECGYQSERKDRFLDLSLPVRNEFDKIYNSSLEMALLNMLKEEKLEKDNKYKCDRCDKKVDALKLLKFEKLPKILFLQLNRFEYDYTTDTRKKLYDRFTFPKVLNLNNFLKDYESILKIYTPEKLKELERRDTIDSQEESEKKAAEFLKEGENVFELFSVVVHTGTPRGGHYYTMIKNFEDGIWYKFDDALVYEMDNKDIAKTFSDGNPHTNNSATGYILMYRKIDKEKDNINFDNCYIQDSLMSFLNEENEKIKIEEQRQIERMNTLQLKFIHNDRIINIFEKKQSTIKQLKSQVIACYNLEKIKEENIRIRNVNNTTYKLLESFDDESKTLQDYNFNSNKTYSIEIKQDNEEFEVYNPNMVIINCCVWDDFYYSSEKEEKDLNFKKIKIDKKIPFAQIKEYLYKHLNLDLNREIFIFRKIDYAHNNYSLCEIDLNSCPSSPNPQTNGFLDQLENKNGDKTNISECNQDKINSNNNHINNNLYNSLLVENSKIFIEYRENQSGEIKQINGEGTENNKNKSKLNYHFSKFVKFFDEKLPNIEIKFNLPLKQDKKVRITVGSYKFDEKIEIKPNKTLKELKTAISDHLNIDVDSFIMKKNSHNGIELKNLSETIDKICTGNSKIYIEYGCPQKENEVKINLFLCELDLTFFLLHPYKVTDLGFYNINLDTVSNVKDLKEYLINELKVKKNIEFNNKEMTVIREYLNERPTKIYNENQSIKDLSFVNNKKIFIQEIKTMETLKQFDSSDFQLTVREWDPENWKVSEPIEIHLKKKTSFLELAKILQEFYPHIKLENLTAYKIANNMNIYMDDILKFKFENLYDNSEFNVDSYPLFINCDGSLLLVSDDSRIARKPTEEEKRLFCKPKFTPFTSKNSVSSGTSLTSSMKSSSSKTEKFNEKKFRVKEKALKITVKKNENFEVEERNGNSDKLESNLKAQEKVKNGDDNLENMNTN